MHSRVRAGSKHLPAVAPAPDVAHRPGDPERFDFTRDEVHKAPQPCVQAAILTLLQDLQRDLDLSLLLITDDLGTVANIADRVLVLNAGEICEQGTPDVLHTPEDDYARCLLAAAPSVTESALDLVDP